MTAGLVSERDTPPSPSQRKSKNFRGQAYPSQVNYESDDVARLQRYSQTVVVAPPPLPRTNVCFVQRTGFDGPTGSLTQRP
ncbi:uncharacterized protein LY79DRAFT_564395 [Colletotrichum navitas]|uniref:Uncharacterized protein n=1 Tax=Colletotrichum navitas TaxID=681940 RepID=A0AAD8UZL5_9PEZI|nr:uncharacterized protein LY79DRAFT_564395 [Colletotrichum navitas]KAK1579395.1 hypothetical protein LY79DRAFT_564395 [Colletotrichum navitas]